MSEYLTDHILKVVKLDSQRPTAFELRMNAAARKSVAALLDVKALSKLRFSGKVAPISNEDWLVTAQLGASVVQLCVLTLAPVNTRIDTNVERRFVAHMTEHEVTEEEVEMTADENSEPLGPEIDLFTIMIEALSLALPLYPKTEGAVMQTASVTEPGKTPITDDETRPFAGLAGLRDSLKNGH